MLYTLAIHPEDASWKIALLRFHEGKPQILCLKTIGLEENPLETLKTILHKKSYQIATAINAEDCATKIRIGDQRMEKCFVCPSFSSRRHHSLS